MIDTVTDTPSVRHVSGWAVVTVGAVLDIYTAPRLRAVLTDLTHTGSRRLIVDARAVTFIDSTGLGVLVGALKRIRHIGSGELRVVANGDPVLHLIRTTGLSSALKTYETLEDALA